MTTIARNWQYAAAAVTLAVALPVMWGDILLASHGASALRLVVGMSF